MKNHVRHYILILVFILVFTLISTDLNATESSTNTGEKWISTQTREHPITDATYMGELFNSEKLHIAISLKIRNKAVLDTLTGDVLASPEAHKLSTSEFMQHHAPSLEHLNAVTTYLHAHDFTNIEIAENHMLISAIGTAGMIKKAFNTILHVYMKNGHKIHTNITPAMVPERLSNIILAITGLQNSNQSLPTIDFPITSNPDVHPPNSYPPSDFSSYYKADKLAPASNTTVALVTQGNLRNTLNDLIHFAITSGYPVPATRIIPIGNSMDDTQAQAQWNLDSQVILAAAGGRVQRLVFYNAATLSDIDLLKAYNQAIIDNEARIINIGLGQCEVDADHSGYAASANAIFQIGVAQGQTFVAAVGIKGIHDCSSTHQGLVFPATSPYVIAVGGTTISGLKTNASPTETVWKNTLGGTSLKQAAPNWQIGTGIADVNDRRVIPDVAFNADPENGASIVFNGTRQTYGGTGLSAALFSGFWARIQSLHNNTLHFPVATFYMGAKRNPAWFNDVGSGENGDFSAMTGWNHRSGFGSLDVETTSMTIQHGGIPRPVEAVTIANANPSHAIGMVKDHSLLYRFYVPEMTQDIYALKSDSATSRLAFHLYGGKGNSDMYIQLGGAPVTSSYLMKSTGPDNNETIIIDNPLSGMYYIRLIANDYVSNATLKINYQQDQHYQKISNGTAIKNIDLQATKSSLYALTLPAGQSSLNLHLSSEEVGDGDLYVRFNHIPDRNTYTAKSDSYSSSESITLLYPKAGTYYIQVYAYKAIRRGVLIAEYKN